MVDLELVKNFSLFKGLTDSQLSKFAARIKKVQYKEGDTVCSKGEKGDAIFIVKSGKASVVLPLYRFDSKYKTISEIGEGEFFGELSFFDGQERTANIIAKEDLELLVLSRQDYDKVIKENFKDGCQIQRNIITGLVTIIRNMNETFSSASFLP